MNKNDLSLAKNTVYYLFYNVLNVLFPFISGIYVARVLLDKNIGEIGYAQNIVQYFVIFAFLGIPTYGLKEIAKVRNEPKQLNVLFSELFIINGISTIFFSIIYYSMILIVPAFRNNYLLYSIIGLSIVLNMLNVSWLFEGLEMFRYISIRSLIVKILSFSLLVILVRKSSDYLWYAIITIISTTGTYLANVIKARKIVHLSFDNLNLRRHLKPVIFLVAVNLAIEIYTLVDVTMLGMMCDKATVAYYNYGSRINKILLQVLNTFTIVVVPRLSLFRSQNKEHEYNQLISNTLSIIIVLSLPIIIGIIFTSPILLPLIYGMNYIRSAKVLNILSLNLVISPVGYLLGSRVMLINNKENKMIYCVAAGAITNIIGNYFLISRFSEVGAAYASVISEICVLTVYLFFSRKLFQIHGLTSTILKVGVSCAVIFSYLFMMSRIFHNTFAVLSFQIIGSIIIYFLILFSLRENTVLRFTNSIIHKICKESKK